METTVNGKWIVPALGLIIGGMMFVASTAGGQPGPGLGMFGVMAVYSGVLVAFGGRSETVAVLRGQPVDERLVSIALQATAASGLVAIVVAIGGFLWDLAHGRSGSDFALVAAAAGLGYLAALLVLRWRR